MKIALALLLTASIVQAQPSHFSSTIGTAALCNEAVDVIRYREYLTKHFGPPAKNKEGADWWNTGGSIYKQPVVSVFVSDVKTRQEGWSFVGVVISAKPTDVATALGTVPGASYAKNTNDQYSTYTSNTHSELMWQENNTKIVCKRYTAPG